MDRRALLKSGGLAVLGFGVGGCAGRAPRPNDLPRFRVDLAPIEASWDRVILTIVGLRPHRPSGFVLRAQKLDAKTVIHNYGHGGAGHSLGWGTAELAAELAMQHGDRRAAVIGCGTVGLTTARQLQRRGFDVTMYAKSVPPDTTSNKALAGFTPTSGLVDRDLRTPEWDAQFRRAAEIAYEQLQLLVRGGYGVSWIDSYDMASERPVAPEGSSLSPLLPAALRTGDAVLEPGEHPFPSRFATRTPWLLIEPAIYLNALMRDVVLFGGRIVIRQFPTSRDLMSLRETLIVNCTGLGARELFNDDEMIPVKGQLTMLVPQPEVDYATSGGVPGSPTARGGFIHMAPRSDGIALGGTAERDVWDLEPNEEARNRIVESHIELFEAMRASSSTAF
ncbi:MAG TPA: FAD-dependent oxidoreductase [Acidobacteriota bacterium]|nr:FAD-dependent oxidoreductase [Acidobacteriota bacterium]